MTLSDFIVYVVTFTQAEQIGDWTLPETPRSVLGWVVIVSYYHAKYYSYSYI